MPIKTPKGLSGSAGLVVAIIRQATVDALNARDPANLADSFAYLGSDRYKAHVTALGLPPEQQPAAMAHMDQDTYLQLTSVILEAQCQEKR